MDTAKMTCEEKLKLAETLLKDTSEVLQRYWFDGSYNNYDVINMSERIDAYFRGDEPLKVASSWQMIRR